MRRLMLELPTVFQAGAANPILFLEDRTYLLSQPDDPEWYKKLDSVFLGDRSRRIWALFDPSSSAPKPAGLLTSTSSPFFVVEAASPRSGHNDWHNKLGPKFFYMKPWRFSEIIQVYVC